MLKHLPHKGEVSYDEKIKLSVILGVAERWAMHAD